MFTLMKSVSGIRGIIGGSLTPDLIVKTASAFAEYSGRGTVVLGRDSRPTGGAVADITAGVLIMSGCRVIDIGIVPTPTVQVAVEEFHADGGIVISASHNPVEWNAFKLIGPRGTFLTSSEIQKLFVLMEDEKSYRPWNGIGHREKNHQTDRLHIEKVLRVTNKDLISKKSFKVAIDSVNGAGSLITQNLLSEYGCTAFPINCTPNGLFPRGAEPLAENLGMLADEVLRSGADIGFAQDPDADRLAIVDEKGRPIGEEYTIALVTEHMLSKAKGRVVVNMSTTKAVEDIARIHGVGFTRTKIGEINVVDEMLSGGARIGGEGNGGVISPEIHYGRDSLAGIGYALEMMAERGKTISELVAQLPSYSMIKGKIKTDKPVNDIMYGIKKSFIDEDISELDGLRIDFTKHPEFAGGWVHLRPSNTEPIFRIISEAPNSDQASDIQNHFMGLLT